MPNPTTGEPIPSRRNYLTRGDAILRVDEGRGSKERQHVFGFVLAGESRLKQEALTIHFHELAAEVGDSLSPNLLVTLDGYTIRWGKIANGNARKRTSLKRVLTD